jgi:hypothetical protein
MENILKGRLRVWSIAAAVFASLAFLIPALPPVACAGPPAGPSGSGKGNVVIARVNGTGITMESVAAMMSSLGARSVHEPAPSGETGDVRREALRQLIFQELAYQKAKSEGLSLKREEVDEAMAEMRRKLGGAEKLRQFMEKERITEDSLRRRIERNLTLKRILTREIVDKAIVSDEEIRKEYERNKAGYARPAKMAVVDVVFFLDPGEAKSLKKARETLRKIKGDKEKNPWKLVPDGAFAVRDVVVREDREKELFKAAGRLSAGEVSDVFSASGNLHIVKLKEYTPPRRVAFEEVKGHIEKKLRARAREKRLEEWGNELRKGAKIEIIDVPGERK